MKTNIKTDSTPDGRKKRILVLPSDRTGVS